MTTAPNSALQKGKLFYIKKASSLNEIIMFVNFEFVKYVFIFSNNIDKPKARNNFWCTIKLVFFISYFQIAIYLWLFYLLQLQKLLLFLTIRKTCAIGL